MRHFSYIALLRQRTIVAGLTLGLIAVMIGVGIDIYISNNRSTIPSTTRSLTDPLNPQLDVTTVETIESYETVTVDGARLFVRGYIDQQKIDSQQKEQEIQQSLQKLGLPQVAENIATDSGQTSTGSEETVSPFIPGSSSDSISGTDQ